MRAINWTFWTTNQIYSQKAQLEPKKSQAWDFKAKFGATFVPKIQLILGFLYQNICLGKFCISRSISKQKMTSWATLLGVISSSWAKKLNLGYKKFQQLFTGTFEPQSKQSVRKPNRTKKSLKFRLLRLNLDPFLCSKFSLFWAFFTEIFTWVNFIHPYFFLSPKSITK